MQIQVVAPKGIEPNFAAVGGPRQIDPLSPEAGVETSGLAVDFEKNDELVRGVARGSLPEREHLASWRNSKRIDDVRRLVQHRTYRKLHLELLIDSPNGR